MAARSASAEGQYLGYSLQLSRLLVLLLEGRESAAVSLEFVGDLAVEAEGRTVLVEEVKSRTSAANPLSDRALDLWKTIRNWMDLIEDGLSPEETEFCLYTTRHFPSHFAQEFHEVQDTTQALRLIDEIVAYFAAQPPSAPLGRFVIPVLRAERRASLASLLVGFRLLHGAGSSRSELLDRLRRTIVPEEHLQDVVQFALGWLKLVTDSQLERRETAVVSVSELRAELTAIVRKLDSQAILNSYAHSPASGDVEAQLQSRMFVRQLELVDEDDIQKVRAVIDYLKAKSDRIQWAERALVHCSDLEELEHELEAAWNSKKTIVAVRDSGHPEKDQGRLLLHECLQHRCKVQGRETPSYFTSGSFHALADDLRVGWHPRYRDFLSSLHKVKEP